ncbi:MULTISPECIES: MscL family protein [unclassified Nocardioides]|uniref:large conductance mechanosensitive channel protein MscL n=1 Tax=unclassified Nocardioides TaxID=2615069 RepID=UPI0007004CE8|nr:MULTISPECIES: MscL family protein [unclassified Nocardioides]KQY56799.1 hypothetical protein ASD30_10865 [Nocardioides sp. Root140]KQZ67005.1 hypothetical protein ASD66_18575 [Nocardioides sp. Root151]
MDGFKNFLLRGNLVEIATGLIMALAFADVVSTFTNWLTSLLPESAEDVFSNELNSFGAFLNAVIAFIIMGAVVYFFVVVPYTKAKERFFPGEAAGPTEVDLLTQIRDSLATKA